MASLVLRTTTIYYYVGRYSIIPLLINGFLGGDGDGEDGGDGDGEDGGDEGEPAAVTAARLAYEDALTALTDEGSAEELPELGRLRATLDAAMGLRETSDSEDDGSDGEEQPVEKAAPTVHTEGS